MDIKDLKGWGTYTNKHCEKVGDLWVHICKYNDESGISYWRWFISVSLWPKDYYALWCDKNRNARKLNTKYFLERDACLEHARRVVTNKQS